jgi:prevent-host-death family protein
MKPDMILTLKTMAILNVNPAADTLVSYFMLTLQLIFSVILANQRKRGDVMHVNTTDLQNSFGKYLALVEKEDIIVTKNGKSVTKLIRYSEPDFF